ncbi:GNAT family N-acetyltransferase [Piscirickettsia salmonis]|uniref:GNAT family N-acetyltransferase n=1 Tax=Piscirickettsia salmonis TaxID=1238 RepID=UPI003A7FA7C8
MKNKLLIEIEEVIDHQNKLEKPDDSEFLLKKASLREVDQLVELRKLLLSQGSAHYAAASPEEDLAWQASYKNWLRQHIDRNTENIQIVIASQSEGRVIGCAIGIIDYRAPLAGCLNGLTGWVQTVVVEPQFRCSGVATELMVFLLEWFSSKEVFKVALQTTGIAQKLYKKLGFKSSGEDLLIKSL